MTAMKRFVCRSSNAPSSASSGLATGPYDLCGKHTTQRCGACEASFFCSVEHQKLLWKCHKHLCGQCPDEPIHFAPLSAHEAEFLEKQLLTKSESVETSSPKDAVDEQEHGEALTWVESLRKAGWWDGKYEEVPSLLSQLQQKTPTLLEPTRSLILSLLRYHLLSPPAAVLAAHPTYLDEITPSEWTMAGHLFHVLASNDEEFSNSKGYLNELPPSLTPEWLLSLLHALLTQHLLYWAVEPTEQSSMRYILEVEALPLPEDVKSLLKMKLLWAGQDESRATKDKGMLEQSADIQRRLNKGRKGERGA
ncbi:hypothetical protein JCM6882_000832 [Rhodosporidiobolus microsporus]